MKVLVSVGLAVTQAPIDAQGIRTAVRFFHATHSVANSLPSLDSARQVFARVRTEIAKENMRNTLRLLWEQAAVELGKKHACPHGAEDHCSDLHFHQEGLRCLAEYQKDFPELQPIFEEEIEKYYRRIIFIYDGSDELPYEREQEFVALHAETVANMLLSHIHDQECRAGLCNAGCRHDQE